jgi:AraC-like DNA-binding protein
MRYGEFAPAPDLRHIVDRYWRLTAPGAAAIERALPDGHCEIVVHLSMPCARIDSTGLESEQPSCILIGQMTRPVDLRPRGSMDVFGVRFRPDAALAPLVDEIVCLRDFCGSAAARWEEQMHGCGSSTDLAAITDAFVRDALLPRSSADLRIQAAIRLLREGGSVGHAAGTVELSRRQFERRFQERVGLGPKLFARIARFQRALALRRAAPHLAWAHIALDCGYFDQAHLAADFREFAGQPPTLQETTAGSLERSLAARDAFFQDSGRHRC